MKFQEESNLKGVYACLLKTFGSQHWWPGETTFEIIVGAILTQNTNWGNVEKAIKRLKERKLLSVKSLTHVSSDDLADAIRPAGYFNVKTKRLKNFLFFLTSQYNGSLKKMEKTETSILRRELLSVNGIGPETADSILLYAFSRSIFVVDTYTQRIFARLNFVPEKEDYYKLQELFHSALGLSTPVFNEYHALIVALGKDYCKPTPCCPKCPLRNRCFYFQKKK